MFTRCNVPVRIIKYDDFKGAAGWGIDDYIAWHRGLVRQYGDKKATKKDGNPSSTSLADYYFINLWARMGMPSKISNTVLLFPSTYKEQLAYFEKYPTLYEVLGFKTIVELKKYNPVNTAANLVSTTTGVVGDIGDTIGTAVKIIKYVVIGGLIFGTIIGGIYAYKKYAA